MNLNNVFYGFTRDGKYRLFWKHFKKMYTSIDDVLVTVYYDLEEKCEFESSFVDTNTLKPITSLVGNVKRMSKRKVKNAFKADANVLIDVKGVFYGDLLEKILPNSVYRKTIDLKQDVLFARVSDPEGRSLEVKTGHLYPRAEHTLKGVCVRESRPIKTEHFDNVVAPKKKLLELDYRKEL